MSTIHTRHAYRHKRGHETKQDAKRAAKSMQRVDGNALHVYQCAGEPDSCGLWFVGRRRKTERQRATTKLPAQDYGLSKERRRQWKASRGG